VQVPSGGIGETLRRAREARRLSLTDAERLTKIRAAYLAALEEERFSALPPRPFAKGFLRTYARLLGLEVEALAAAFDARGPLPTDARLRDAVEIPLEPAAPPSPLRRLFSYALWILVLAGIGLAYVGYTQLREFARTRPLALSTPAPGPFASVPAPFEDVPGPQAGPLPTPETAPSATRDHADRAPAVDAPAEGVTFLLVATGTSWLRVTVDGGRVFEGFVQAGDVRRWTAERELLIRIGDASAVELTVNGQTLGVLGGPGEVITRRFTATPREP
jgi:transcriptional regulator with XRE-family HTH domain